MIDQRCRLDLAGAQTQLTQWLRLQLVAAQAPPRREIPEVSFLTRLRHIQCEAFEIAERAMDQGTIVGSTQDYPGRLVCIESFLPAGRT